MSSYGKGIAGEHVCGEWNDDGDAAATIQLPILDAGSSTELASTVVLEAFVVTTGGSTAQIGAYDATAAAWTNYIQIPASTTLVVTDIKLFGDAGDEIRIAGSAITRWWAGGHHLYKGVGG